MQSFILDKVKCAAKKVVPCYNDSFIGKTFMRICKGIDKGINDSCIVSFFTGAEKSDMYYNKAASLTAGRFMSMLGKLFGFASKGVRNSAVYNFLKLVCESFFSIPLMLFGITFLIAGVGLLAGGVIINRGTVTLLISVVMCLCGGLLMLFKRSLSELFAGSFLFGILLKVLKADSFEGKRVAVSACGFVVVGIIYAAIGAAFGLFPLALAIALTLAAAFAFYKTQYCVIITAGVLPFMPTMVMVALCLGIAAVIFVKAVLSFKDNFEGYSSSENIFVALMCVAFAVSACFSVAAGSSIRIVMVYIAFTTLYFSMVKVVKGKKNIMALLYTVSAAALPVALYGIYQKLVGFDEQNTWIDTEMFDNISGRVVSFFENPNVFGEYLIIAIMLAVAAMVIVRPVRYKLFFGVTVLCLAASMIFTYSRGCWIGIVIAVALFLFMTNRKLFFAACVLGVISLFFLPESITGRIMSVGNMSDSSTSYRVYIWMGTLRLLKDYWFIGIGQGSDAFNMIYPSYSYSAIEAPHAHNLYLLIMTEMGVLGAVCFVAVIVVFFRKMFYVIKNTAVREYKILSAAIASAMAGFLVQGMFDNVWYNYRVFLLFWVVIAFGILVYIAEKKREDRGNFYR